MGDLAVPSVPNATPGISVLTRLVLAEEPLENVLDTVVNAAVATIPVVSSASVTLRVNGGYETPTATIGEALEIDAAQYRADGGPCVEATRGLWVNVPVVAEAAARWPEFAAAAQEVGVQSSLGVPLAIGGVTLGALNLHANEPNAFGPEEEHLARQVADQAAATITNAQALAAATTLNEQLRQAMLSRELIGRATGIIMVRERCGAEAAFDILRKASQNSNRKLRDLAAEVCDAAERVGRG